MNISEKLMPLARSRWAIAVVAVVGTLIVMSLVSGGSSEHNMPMNESTTSGAVDEHAVQNHQIGACYHSQTENTPVPPLLRFPVWVRGSASLPSSPADGGGIHVCASCSGSAWIWRSPRR